MAQLTYGELLAANSFFRDSSAPLFGCAGASEAMSTARPTIGSISQTTLISNFLLSATFGSVALAREHEDVVNVGES
jgi:hypothetical protein